MDDQLPPACLDTLGIAVDADIAVNRQEIVPGTGSCAPSIYGRAIDRSACDAICPAP